MIVSVASASVLAATANAQVLGQPLPEVSLPAPALPVPLPALPVPTAPLPVPTAPLPVPTPELPALAPLVQLPGTSVTSSLPDTPVTSPLPVPDTSGSLPGAPRPVAGVAAPDAQPGAGRASAAAPRRDRDARLGGARLRRLRTVLRERWSCAGSLSRDQRRTLILRAGLLGKKPLPRTAIARRIGVTPARALRLERTGVAALRRGGTCAESGGATAGAAG